MSSILVFSRSYIPQDPRVRRQLEFLSKKNSITCLGYGDFDMTGVKYLNLLRNLSTSRSKGILSKILSAKAEGRLLSAIVSRMSRLFPSWFPFVHTIIKEFLIHRGSYARDLKEELQKRKYDLIVANDLSALSVCIWAAGGTKVLYDAHEYSLDQATQDRKWRREHYPYVRYTLSKYLHRCSAVCTVSDGIAEEYARVFGIERPIVVRNAAMFRNQPPRFNTGSRIRLVHHGVAARQRSIEDMIRVAKDLGDRFELDLYLLPNDPKYYDKIVDGASDCERIHFYDPIPMPLISEHLNQYDVGLYILPPKNFNQVHALPNKLFEFIQARLAIAVSPSPEMAAVVREHNLGVVAKDFTVSAMVEALKDLSIDQINEFKRNSDHCAELLSAEKEMEKFERIIAGLLEA